MASIALSIIGCIDYLAYGTIFMRAMFRPKKNLMFFFPPEKPEMSPGEWCALPVLPGTHTSEIIGCPLPDLRDTIAKNMLSTLKYAGFVCAVINLVKSHHFQYTHPYHVGRHRPTAAMVPPPPGTAADVITA